MTSGTWVLLAALVLATAFGVWRSARDGRFRGAQEEARMPEQPGPDESAGAGLDGLGERATLLQFSSAFCAPCRATRRVLGEVAEVVPGVTHVEVDAEEHLDLTRRLGILRTPTTLVLDAAGREISRASGAPSRDSVLVTLSRALDAPA